MLALILIWYLRAFIIQTRTVTSSFVGQRALESVQTQVAFGPRTPGSIGHAKAREWICSELTLFGWNYHIQHSEMLGHPIQNIIANRNDRPPEIILAAHYDTRLFADNDPDLNKRGQPVPGANDGGSGVAVLLELARILPSDVENAWLVFFDAEDNGRIEGWDWILGSRAFVAELNEHPLSVVIIDMIGDADQNIFIEKNSDRTLVNEIWTTAANLGYENRFIPEEKYSMLDDHSPFIQAGIPAIDIIDFDYAYWHTTSDTPDKVTAESLGAVGETLYVWVIEKAKSP